VWVADPKAINHILKNSTTTYRKLENVREMIAFILDRGLAWADGNTFPSSIYSQILTLTGDTHKRQRRAMTPAFGLVEAKGLLPYFAQSVAKVCNLIPTDRYNGLLFTADR
jgi:cytochrome P450